jgi:tRNA modification GTPase
VITGDTIFALATAPGRAAVAVVRISGPATRYAVAELVGRLPEPRRASLRRLYDPNAGELLDEGLVLWFSDQAGFTGEDAAELQLHGGPAVVEAVMEALAGLGLRIAEPGEFSRRAFENGRMDLAGAEAVADLIDAETAGQRRQALAQLGGALSDRYERWRAALVEALAWLEAEIDFPDEDLPDALSRRAGGPLASLSLEIDAALGDLRGQRVREGLRVALIGPPNAGKSSLINALAGRDAAIVTNIPGTTRDVIEVALVISGFKVLLADTAGLRESADPVEIEGVRRARAWAEGADLRLWIVDPAGGLPPDLVRPDDLVVLSKSDLGPVHVPEVKGIEIIAASTVTPDGLDSLRATLAARVEALAGGSDFPAATRLRHRALLEEAAGHLHRAVGALADDKAAELVAEDVRLTARALERLSGRIDSEAVLDRVFATFCIGK